MGVNRTPDRGNPPRLNLTRDRGGEARRPAPNDAAKERRPKTKTVPRLQYQMLKALYGERQGAPDDEPIPHGHCCSLLEFSEQRCRWPSSTPGAAGLRFCCDTLLERPP